MKVNVTKPDDLAQEEFENVKRVDTDGHALVLDMRHGTFITFEPDEWTAFAVERED